MSLSPAPSRSPTPGDSDPENNTALHTEELEARIEVFLEEAEEDLMMEDLPPAENTSPLPVPAPVFPGIIPFAMSTGQHCCHRYDFSVCFWNGLNFFKLFKTFILHLGLITTPMFSMFT